MITRIASFVLSMLVLLSLGVSESSAQPITRSGPTSAFAARLVSFPIAESDLLTATITTGTSNRILIIQGTITDNLAGGAASLYSIRPVINNDEEAQFHVQPTGFGYSNLQVSFGTLHANTMTMTWWVDLDTAGLANVPLTITLQGSSFPNRSPAHVSFTAYTVAR